jgi:uncharacterized protein
MLPDQLDAKRDKLTDLLGALPSLAVAFSGGVDSAFLAVMARQVLGERMIALKAVSAVHSQREHRAAIQFAQAFDIPLQVITTHELEAPGFAANPPDRCYLCKKYLMGLMVDAAEKLGFTHIAHGANLDDLDDYRPGFKATRELGITAPLIDAGLTKADIRNLSRDMELPTWDRPSMACLASRVPYGTPLSADVLDRVARAEEVLYKQGLAACRVRHHGRMARIEIAPAEFSRIMAADAREEIVTRLKALGYDHVCLDLEGYVQGSLNRALEEPDD